MPSRFQADADLNQIIVSAVVRRVPTIDFKTATATGLAGLEDLEVLAAAARDGRLLVTHDQATMPRCRRPHSDLDGHATGGMDGSNRFPADLPLNETD
jgi:hypothetical protein